MFQTHTSVQAQRLLDVYVGKWMRVAGALGDADDFGDFIQVTFTGRPQAEHHVYMYFDMKWADRLTMIKKGRHINVVGRVKNVDSASVHLEKCELE